MEVDVLKKVPVSEQDPKVRATNFNEVNLGYTKEEAMAEATRCLNCKNARCIQLYRREAATGSLRLVREIQYEPFMGEPVQGVPYSWET